MFADGRDRENRQYVQEYRLRWWLQENGLRDQRGEFNSGAMFFHFFHFYMAEWFRVKGVGHFGHDVWRREVVSSFPDRGHYSRPSC